MLFRLCLALLPASLPAQTDLSPRLEAIRAQYHLAGLTAMGILSGRIVAQGAAGVQRWGYPRPISVDDLVNIGSCTKWMTATVAGRLVDQGVIAWTTRVREVFPNYATFQPGFSEITLEQLLAHRGGVEDGITWEAKHNRALYAYSGTISQVRRWAAEAALRDAPQVAAGTFLYANQGYTIAAAMLELKSGQTWETLIAQQVFAPLQMNSARLGMSFQNTLPPTGVTGHDLASATAQPIARVAPGALHLANYQGSNGAGGHVVCTLRDWGLFLSMHARGGAGYLTAATAEKLRTPLVGSTGYALGVDAESRAWAAPGLALNHSGDIFGEHCVMWMSPGRDFITMAFTNTRSADNTVNTALDEAITAVRTAGLNSSPAGTRRGDTPSLPPPPRTAAP